MSDSPPAYAASPVYDSGSGVCSGILRELKYTVVHDGNGTISAVQADVVIGSHTSLSGPVAIEQAFEIVYESSTDVTRSASKNNLVDVDRSGNPGYLSDLPLRVGQKNAFPAEDDASSSLSAISELEEGLRIIAPGECSTDLKGLAQVSFGQDIQTSCTKSLTQTDFEAFCTANVVPPELLLTATHVAAFGSADPLTPSEWIDLSKSIPEESGAVFSATTGKCTDIVSENVSLTTAVAQLFFPC